MKGMTLNRRTGSGSDLAVAVDSTEGFSAVTSLTSSETPVELVESARSLPLPVLRLSLMFQLGQSNRPGRYRFLFCG